jgi:hypothetical protein
MSIGGVVARLKPQVNFFLTASHFALYGSRTSACLLLSVCDRPAPTCTQTACVAASLYLLDSNLSLSLAIASHLYPGMVQKGIHPLLNTLRVVMRNGASFTIQTTLRRSAPYMLQTVGALAQSLPTPPPLWLSRCCCTLC